MKNIERWKIVKGFADYVISDRGRVKRLTKEMGTFPGKILKPYVDIFGYLGIGLQKCGERYNLKIHRLVARAFIGPCPKGKEVNHIDGNKRKPYYKNLEYVTRSENLKHAYRIGLQKNRRGSNNGRSTIDEKKVKKIRSLFEKGMTRKQLSKKFNVPKGTMNHIVSHRTWQHV